MTTKTIAFPTLERINHQQANYGYYLAKLQKVQTAKPTEHRT